MNWYIAMILMQISFGEKWQKSFAVVFDKVHSVFVYGRFQMLPHSNFHIEYIQISEYADFEKAHLEKTRIYMNAGTKSRAESNHSSIPEQCVKPVLSDLINKRSCSETVVFALSQKYHCLQCVCVSARVYVFVYVCVSARVRAFACVL